MIREPASLVPRLGASRHASGRFLAASEHWTARLLKYDQRWLLYYPCADKVLVVDSAAHTGEFVLRRDGETRQDRCALVGGGLLAFVGSASKHR